MSCNLINRTPRRWANTENGHATCLDLGPASILDHLRRDSLGAGLLLELKYLFLRLDLKGNLCLTEGLPSAEEVGGLRGCGGGAREGLVAGEGCMRALSSDFA